MHERSRDRSGLVWLILIAAIVAAGIYFHRSGAAAAIDETIDTFVPDAEGFERRANVIGDARQAVDAINARQGQTTRK